MCVLFKVLASPSQPLFVNGILKLKTSPTFCVCIGVSSVHVLVFSNASLHYDHFIIVHVLYMCK